MSNEQKLREALQRIQYKAVSLADAQVIALEALALPATPPAAAPAPDVPQGFKPVGYLRSDEFDGHVFEPIDGTWPFDELLFSLSTSPEPVQEVTLTEWISVDERLPDGEPGDPAIEFYNEDLRNPMRQVIGIYRDGAWYSGGHQFSNVSYWKPLTPAPIAALREKERAK